MKRNSEHGHGQTPCNPVPEVDPKEWQFLTACQHMELLIALEHRREEADPPNANAYVWVEDLDSMGKSLAEAVGETWDH